MAGKDVSLSGQKRDDSRRPLWLDVLDVSAKLLGAVFLLAVAWIGNSFQARLTGLNLQSQREQAESQLRANMFTNLISPIVGAKKEGEQLKPDREELLVELLALNFQDDFELKPLMEDVDKKLAEASAAPAGKSAGPGEAASPESQAASEERESLRSIARRVADRQLGSIQWEWAAGETGRSSESAPVRSSDPACHVYTITFYERLPDATAQEQQNGPANPCISSKQFETDAASAPSPDGVYALYLIASKPDWSNQSVNFDASVYTAARSQANAEAPLTYEFALSWFDLPLTDNTLLPDGNRFAVNLQAVQKPEQNSPGSMRVRILWFPKGYFTLRERPLNFQEVRKLIGLDQ